MDRRATSIRLFSWRDVRMRTFHMTWFAFFLCFFAWFGIAPMMKVVRAELKLTDAQVGNCIIASVAITVFARLFIGWLCDRIGPRISYTVLLLTGSIPVMLIGFAHDYESFLYFRLAIGVIGASFVITQYHTTLMFAPNCVGTANATTAGWGNLGGGVTNLLMPLVFAGFVGLGMTEFWSWRLSMVAAGITCFAVGIAYFFLTTDTPDGNFRELRREGKIVQASRTKGSFLAACKDYRVWSLFVIYGACFGIELTINNVAALYFADYFELSMTAAGITAGLFGLMNIFARSLGGYISDRFGISWGLRGRVRWLFIALFIEGIALMAFSTMGSIVTAITLLITFSLFVQMSEGATFSVVPFINKKAIGSVSGIVGAGGNAGAVAAGFLFKGSIPWPSAFLILGIVVTAASFLAFTVRFTPLAEASFRREIENAQKEMSTTARVEEEPELATRH